MADSSQYLPADRVDRTPLASVQNKICPVGCGEQSPKSSSVCYVDGKTRIRRFRLADVPYVVEHQIRLNEMHCSFDATYYELAERASEEFANYISNRIDDPDFCLLVAEHGASISGYIMGWVELRPPIYRYRKVGYLSNVYVSKDYRGLGIGEKLYTVLEDWLKQRCVDLFELRVDIRNIQSIGRFLRERGFKEISISLCNHCVPDD